MSEITDVFIPDFCLICGKEMRKWISDEKCISMCVINGCQEHGNVKPTIQNINNIQIKISVGLE